MIAQLSAIFDEWYVIDVSIRRKANIAYRKSQHKTVGLPPFGTKRNAEGYLIPSDEGAWLFPVEADDIRRITQMMMCVDAVGKLTQLWEASSGEDCNRMAQTLSEHVVFDLDQRRIMDFKLKPWMDQFIILQAAVLWITQKDSTASYNLTPNPSPN